MELLGKGRFLEDHESEFTGINPRFEHRLKVLNVDKERCKAYASADKKKVTDAS